MKKLIKDIKDCTICAEHLELGPRPVVSIHPDSKIVIIGQAPGTVVHRTGIPWDDKSGKRLREWMGISDKTFYNSKKIAIVPMGFCYPGKGKSGDLPPRKECAPEWHETIFKMMKQVELTLLIGKYAQDYYLRKTAKRNLTENVKAFHEFLPEYFVLPHPSPRNNIWMKRNDWFEGEVLPALAQTIEKILA